MAKKYKRAGFTPEIHELFDTLYAKLREYGQCCAYIAICDNKNRITKRIGVLDEVTYKEDKEIIMPDLAIVNAMGGESSVDIAGRHLVYNAVLSYLHEHPEEIPEFYKNLQAMLSDLLEDPDEDDGADTPVEAEIPIIIPAKPNPHGDC